MSKPKNLIDYQNLAISKGFKYILLIIPSNVSTKTDGWKCSNNHEWPARYSDIYSGNGCPYCAGCARKNLNDYIELANKKGFTYILDHIAKNTNTPIEGWKCSKGHIWPARYEDIKMYGCPYCSGKKKKVLNDYVQIATDSGFTYILTKIPKNNGTSIKGWKCSKNHIWSARYNDIQSGDKCPVCSKKRPKILIDYKNLAITKDFTYILESIPSNSKISIHGWKCKENHTWSANYNNIDRGSGCPICKSHRSEKLCGEILEACLDTQFHKKKPTFLKGLEYDRYNSELKLALEYQGIQHSEYTPTFHRNGIEDFNKLVTRDKLKVSLSQQYQVNLIIVPHTYDFKKPNLLKDYIIEQLLDLGYGVDVQYMLSTI